MSLELCYWGAPTKVHRKCTENSRGGHSPQSSLRAVKFIPIDPANIALFGSQESTLLLCDVPPFRSRPSSGHENWTNFDRFVGIMNALNTII